MKETYFDFLKKKINIANRETTGKIVAVDFDGTITKDNKFPDVIGVVREGCKETIEYIRKNNKVVIWTCRSGKHLDEAAEFLKANGIEVDGINVDLYTKTDRKIMADVYIDDKNIFCNEIDWFEIKRWFEEDGLKKTS